MNYAVESFNFDFKEGSFISIIGPIGSGKTTLLKEIVCNYSNINVSFVNRDCYFLKSTVREELRYILKQRNVPNSEIKSRIKRVLNKFNMYKCLDSEISLLTNNQKLILNIARAVISNPDILLIDNVLSFLVSDDKKTVMDYFKKLNNCGMTVLLVTNDLEECLETKKVLVINNHKKLLEDRTIRVLSNEKLLNNLGLEMPFMIDLSLKLKDYGLLKKTILDEKRMTDILWK